MKRIIAMSLAVLSVFLCSPGNLGMATAQEASADEWSFEVAPYGWATAVGSDVTKNGRNLSSHMSMGDVVEALDLAFFLHAEARKGPWGVYADFMYAKLGENGTLTLPGPIEVGTNVELKEYIAELGGMYSFQKAEHGFDVLYGGRYVYLKTSGGVGQQHTSISNDWLDPVIGGRYRYKFSDKWAFSFRGDIGGFGFGSDFTWNLSTVFRYAMTDKVDLALGYRYLNVDYDSGGTDLDMEVYGPIVGAIFKF